jgi:hypothetical protein
LGLETLSTQVGFPDLPEDFSGRFYRLIDEINPIQVTLNEDVVSINF